MLLLARPAVHLAGALRLPVSVQPSAAWCPVLARAAMCTTLLVAPFPLPAVQGS